MYKIQVRIQQAKPQAAELAKDIFGGSISIARFVSLNGKKQKRQAPLYVWCITGPTANRALKALLPYLRIKQRQAELAIELQATIRTKSAGPVRLDPSVLAKRDVLVDAIRTLNLSGKGKTRPQKQMSFDYSNTRPYAKMTKP